MTKKNWKGLKTILLMLTLLTSKFEIWKPPQKNFST